MLIFVGLGLYDLDDISIKGLQAIKEADAVFLESYTSVLTGTTIEQMRERYGKDLIVLKRQDVEQTPEPILTAAKNGIAVFLTGGDPMVSTTHADLRIRAQEQGISTKIIHGSSIVSAVSGLTGLQNYRFGKSCSIPYPAPNWFPKTPLDTILANLIQNLHTTVYLDIQENRYMSVHEGIELLEKLMEGSTDSIPLYVGVARAGSDSPVVAAGSGERLKQVDFGPPLHILVVPASLHEIEEEYLKNFAGYVPQ
ncbi:diphthine synthase [Methanospirillum hungatei]|uniref:diphthine synthase n=1 Tax=Methanospirillum hungatei TaxID=2203 RepID=UPI0026F07FC8|nr:diphthine synthase [Methanospirillum hungatei]MCA1915644.1 diphthine synthase [Methanospirillum hungatei]